MTTKRPARSFDAVDFKLAEADFFLEKMADATDFYEANFYFSAFVSAARSVTFALQAVLKRVEGFEAWYDHHRGELEHHPLARRFNRLRNDVLKTGELALIGGRAFADPAGSLVVEHRLRPLPGSDLDVGERDAISLSREYLRAIVNVVADCYDDLGDVIDPDRYYTPENLERLGLSIDDIEESLGLPRGWTTGIPPEERLKALREAVPGSQIKPLFEKYGVA